MDKELKLINLAVVLDNHLKSSNINNSSSNSMSSTITSSNKCKCNSKITSNMIRGMDSSNMTSQMNMKKMKKFAISVADMMRILTLSQLIYITGKSALC